jgi:hypothetical protein
MKSEEEESDTREFATAEEIQRAKDEYEPRSDDCIEIDDQNVKVSVSDNGVWVQAWVWLQNEEDEAGDEPQP